GGPAVGADPAEDRHGRPPDPERAGPVRGWRGEGDRRGRSDRPEPDGGPGGDAVRSVGAGGHVGGGALGGDPGCGAKAGRSGGGGGGLNPLPAGEGSGMT